MWVAQAMWWVAQAMWWEGCTGYVVDYTPIIEPPRGPTCMFKTSKISTQVKIVSWARVGQLSKYQRKGHRPCSDIKTFTRNKLVQGKNSFWWFKHSMRKKWVFYKKKSSKRKKARKTQVKKPDKNKKCLRPNLHVYSKRKVIRKMSSWAVDWPLPDPPSDLGNTTTTQSDHIVILEILHRMQKYSCYIKDHVRCIVGSRQGPLKDQDVS